MLHIASAGSYPAWEYLLLKVGVGIFFFFCITLEPRVE